MIAKSDVSYTKIEEIDKVQDTPSLSKRVVRSSVWIFSGRIVQRIFDFIRTIILARLLSPKDFGLFGICLLTISILETFSESGFNVALIQKKLDIKPYLDTAWTVNLIRGTLLAIILFLVASPIAKFFNSPNVIPILRVLALIQFIKSAQNIGMIYFRKELQFHKSFIFQTIVGIAGLVIGIITAYLLKNVWALVYASLTTSLVGLIVSYVIHPYRPNFGLHLNKAKELFNFGRWVLGSSVLMFLITQGDDIFVGKLLGVTALGFYQMAYKISNLPATEITHVISRVVFSAYSKLQSDRNRLKEAYLKVLQVTGFFSFLIATLILVLASDFTKIFLGEKWMPIVPVMQVLVFAGLVRSMAATAGYIFYAVGKPKIDAKLQIARLLILIILIYPFTVKWGIIGTSIVVLLSTFISAIGFSLKVIEITKCETKKFSKLIAIPFINGVATILLLVVLKPIMGNEIWSFILFACIGIVAYFFMTYLSDKFFNYKMQTLIKEILQQGESV